MDIISNIKAKIVEKNFEIIEYKKDIICIDLNLQFKSIIIYITFEYNDDKIKWITTAKYYRFSDLVKNSILIFDSDDKLINYIVELNNKLRTSKFIN